MIEYVWFLVSIYAVHIMLFYSMWVSVSATISILLFSSYGIHAVTHTDWYLSNAEKYNEDWKFHHSIHHDSSVNTQMENICYEFFQNIFTTSLIWFPPAWVLLHIPTCISFGFIYASYHLINQRLLDSRAHLLHHKNEKYNYGFDFMDVLFGTKHPDDKTYEDLTTGVLNVVICAFTCKFVISKIEELRMHSASA